jgi:PPE-repeat protein
MRRSHFTEDAAESITTAVLFTSVVATRGTWWQGFSDESRLPVFSPYNVLW